MTSLRKKEIWKGQSPDGFLIEIAHWGEDEIYHSYGVWNYYVFIYEQQLRPDDWKKVWLKPKDSMKISSGVRIPRYAYYDSILSDAYWHGGITYYEKIQEVDSDIRYIKVGCDYAHLADEGRRYTMPQVLDEALQTCADLARLLKPLTRCSITGMYFEPSIAINDHPFYKGPLSPAGLGWMTEWDYKNARKDQSNGTATI